MSDFVSSIKGFECLNHTEKIKFFCWYVLNHKGCSTFTARIISECFSEIQASPPSSVASFLSSLSSRKPPILLKKTDGSYVLERRTKETLDKKYGKRESTVVVERILTELPGKVHEAVERAYLEEALVCFRHGAFRASIVMVWNLAFDHLCQIVLAKKLAEFNAQLPRTCPKAKIQVITSRDDLTDFKESEVLQVCRSAGIVTGNLDKVLKEKLNRRNIAAHPSGVQTTQLTAEEFIRDLVENVVLKI